MSGVLTAMLKASVEITKLILETVRNCLIVAALVVVAFRVNEPWLVSAAGWLWLAVLIYFLAQSTLLVEKAIKFLTREDSTARLPWAFESTWFVRLLFFLIIGFVTAKLINYQLAEVLQSVINSDLARKM